MYVSVCANSCYVLYVRSVRERERDIEYVLSVIFILLFTIFICLASAIVGFGYLAIVRSLK